MDEPIEAFSHSRPTVVGQLCLVPGLRDTVHAPSLLCPNRRVQEAQDFARYSFPSSAIPVWKLL